MAPQQTQQDSVEEAETVHLSAGYRASLSFVLVPRTSVTFDPPDTAAVARFANPKTLLLELPIRGTARNFPAKDTPCSLTWQVSRGGQLFSYPVAGAVMKIASGGKFHVEVAGKNPTVDLIAQALVGEGKLGFSLAPDFPHADPATFAPAIAFKNPCEIQVVKPEKPLLGEHVTFKRKFASIFDQADLELRVREVDEGSGEIASASPQIALSHRWAANSLWHSDPSWAIGFSGETCEQLADVGEEETGAFEYTWELWGTSKQGNPQTLLLHGDNFLVVPRPKLEEFCVEYAPSWEGTWEVHGRITGVSPKAGLMLEAALVLPNASGPVSVNPHVGAVQFPLYADGAFEGHLGERHYFQSATSATPPPKAYAVLSLPAARRGGQPGPVGPYLDYDDNRFSAFKGGQLSWDTDAEWVTSEEAIASATRPPRPTRRKSGVNRSPAPPPEAGDQKTPLSFDDIYADISAWEGIVAYMYLDTKGYVTVGAGNLLSSVAAAKALPFVNMDTNKAATGDEIATAYNTVKGMRAGMRHTEYALRPNIALRDADIRQLAKGRCESEFLPHLKKNFPDFESYPRAARRALIDMVYNVGTGKFPADFPKCTASIKAKKWSTAAEQCHVQSPNEDRNEWRKALFMYANTVAKS